MKRLPLGMQSLREIICDGYVYVDKTPFVYSLINDTKHYFLSRPRRFGKSLLLDTIAEIFSGDKELFRGLFIYDSDFSFEKHPVLRLDMSNIANESTEILKEELSNELQKRVRLESFDFDYNTPSAIFKALIEGLYKKYDRRVVVLIDEYDKPILDQINRIELAEANRDMLSGFYGVLKSMDPFLRLTFITGVTKFTKTSIFSGLNNLRDITMSRKYANICGIATNELSNYFGEHMEKLSSLEEFSRYDSILEKILLWYDGYSWDGKSRLINPFSLLYFFSEEQFSNYWYASGTPTFLIKLLKNKPESFLTINDLEISKRVLDTFDIRKISVLPLLFQTGYLTVKEALYRGEPDIYLLEIPNHEVREALYMNIVAEFTERDEDFAESAYRRIKESLNVGDLQNILEILKSLFASIPYQLHMKHEHYYHAIFYTLMNLLGFSIVAEESVSGGRIDAVLELDDKVYVIEFKYVGCDSDTLPEEKQTIYDKALDEGMRQINNKGYAKKYTGSGKVVYKVAFAFLGRDYIEFKMEL